MMTELSTVEATPLARAEPPTIEHLMMAAIERGADVETLERLVALQRQVAADKARASYIEAMGKFRRTVPPIVKNKQGAKAKYADLSHISKIVDPVLHDNGLIYDWDTEESGKLTTIICKISHRDGHQQTSRFTAPVEQPDKVKNGAQQVASTATYGKRQALINALGIIVDDDTDGRPTPGTAPDADKTQPSVGTRQERASDAPVTAEELNELWVESGKGNGFIPWAEENLQCGGLDKVSGWTRKGLNYLWNIVNPPEAGDANE